MKITIVGGTGYTGGELLRILTNHPEVDEIEVTSRKKAGADVSEVHPNIDPGLKFTKLDTKKASKSDFVFCCMPHTEAMNTVPKIKTKVIDLSADFRLKNPNAYEKYYNVKHTCPTLLKRSVYGLTELHRREIKNATIVANPGCFPTGAILACHPLVKEFDVDKLVIDSKTGVSGAGATPKEETHFPTVNENVVPYKVVEHQHIPEMEQELNVKVHFTPHLVPLTRGILTTVHAFVEADEKEIFREYEKAYKKEPFLRVQKTVPSLLAVRGSNKCVIGGFNAKDGRLVLFSAIDNLVKGASGQAVQNMNVMAGLDETSGLKDIGLNP